MPVSEWPWWCGPELARGATCVRPIHSARAPTASPLIAAKRVMPDVCAVPPVQASAGTWRSRSIRSRLLEARVERVAEAVAEQVERQHGAEDGQAGERGQVGVREDVVARGA